MALATIDSVATTKTLRSNLRELPTFSSTIKGDIELLHSYFDSNYTQIIARGATVKDPVDILFSAYMVVPCNNFRSHIKRKQDAYTDGTLTLAHKELIMLATNKFNLLKQEGTWGAKSPDEDKIVAMQAELSALRGQFQLAPNLKRAAGAKDDDKKQEARNKVEGITGNRRTRRTTPTRRNRREMKTGRRHLPRKGKRMKRRSRDVPGISANTTWHRETTRKSSANSATSAPTSKPAASTKSQPKPPRRPSSTFSGKPSWPT
jgi:hypothetical protein